MKRILVVSHGAALGGSPISALNIARNLDPSRFAVAFAFGEDGPLARQAAAEGYAVDIVDRKGFIGLAMIRRYLRIIAARRIDVVHLNTLTSYYKYPAFAAKLAGKPVAWFVRENPEEKRCLRLRWHLRHLARKVVTVSHDTAAHLPRVAPDQLLTIHNGVDLDAFQPLPAEEGLRRLGLPPGDYLTTVGTLEPRKGVLDLVEAYAQALPRLGATRLLIVGSDRSRDQAYADRLRRRIAELGLADRVILFGESKDIPAVMAASRWFVLVSYWEGLSRVLLEALACGKPILASDAGGNKEQVWPGENGYTCAAGDIAALAGLLEKTTDDALTRRFGAASRRLAETHFSMVRTNAALERLYDSLA